MQICTLWLFDTCPGFEFFQLNIMADPIDKMCLSSELSRENEYSGVSAANIVVTVKKM